MTGLGMTGSEGGHDRRGFFKVAAVVAAAGAGALLPGLARAEPLPPVGVDVPCSLYAANVPLRLNILGRLELDFKGGIDFTVRSSTEQGRTLEVQAFRLEADTSPSTPDSGSLIVLTMSNTTLTPLSVLQQNAHGEGELLIYLALTVTMVDKPTGVETVVAVTDPARYATLRSARLKSFPPFHQSCTLREPVPLYAPGDTQAQGGPVIGELSGFDGVITQSE